jgi:hypothetical protein
MLRRGIIPVAALVVTLAIAGVAGAAPITEAGSEPPLADHLGGASTVCGRLLEYVAPTPGTEGSVTIHGIVEYAAHTLPISDAVPADPTIASLAASGEWSCLDVVGDGSGLVMSMAVASASVVCGRAEATVEGTGLRGQATTVILDGEAGAIVSADGELARLLDAISSVSGPTGGTTCLGVTLAGDGTVTGLTLDYELVDGLLAPVACGPVDGTPIAYRDPASQEYPGLAPISVDGFEVDASIVPAPFHPVLAHHLDAGLDLCLIVRVEDSAVVDAALLTTGPETCGRFEIRGGLVFVNAVVVSQSLTAVNFAEPATADLGDACLDARAQESVASGSLTMCGVLDGVGASGFTVDGVTFHLEAPVVADASLASGSVRAFRLDGPNPFMPFGVANPALLVPDSREWCVAPLLPDTATTPSVPGARLLVVIAWLTLGTSAVAVARWRVR